MSSLFQNTFQVGNCANQKLIFDTPRCFACATVAANIGNKNPPCRIPLKGNCGMADGLLPLRDGCGHQRRHPLRPRLQASRRFTASLMALPSARPASCFDATPITRPMSLMVWAPVWAMISLTAASISSAVSGCGR